MIVVTGVTDVTFVEVVTFVMVVTLVTTMAVVTDVTVLGESCQQPSHNSFVALSCYASDSKQKLKGHHISKKFNTNEEVK